MNGDEQVLNVDAYYDEYKHSGHNISSVPNKELIHMYLSY
jgi:hypothetical protein